MRVCPNNALHPTLSESGFEGLWTPYLIARIGYCEPTCTLCGQVCPTGAIQKLTVVQKVGDKETPPNRIGTAFVDRGRCLPWAMATPCIVCEEWCPTSPKAVYLIEETAVDSRGRQIRVKRPYIDAGPLHRVRRLRVCLSRERPQGDLHHLSGRVALRDKPDPAGTGSPETGRGSAELAVADLAEYSHEVAAQNLANVSRRIAPPHQLSRNVGHHRAVLETLRQGKDTVEI